MNVRALVATLMLGFSLGCSGTRSAADLPATEAPPAAPAAVEPVGGAPVARDGAPVDAPSANPVGVPLTPAALYEGCRDRVEGPETAGECTTDADCAKVGCSQEMCIAARNAGDVMTTCEVLPCFRALDTCGCREGTCGWSVRAELPPGPGRIPLPVK